MSFCEDDAYIIHMANIHHKSVAISEDGKKEEEGEDSGEQHLEMQAVENSHEVGVTAVGLVEEDEQQQHHQEKSEVEESAEHLVQQNEENKDGGHEINEQVVAERSIQEG